MFLHFHLFIFQVMFISLSECESFLRDSLPVSDCESLTMHFISWYAVSFPFRFCLWELLINPFQFLQFDFHFWMWNFLSIWFFNSGRESFSGCHFNFLWSWVSVGFIAVSHCVISLCDCEQFHLMVFHFQTVPFRWKFLMYFHFRVWVFLQDLLSFLTFSTFFHQFLHFPQGFRAVASVDYLYLWLMLKMQWHFSWGGSWECYGI